VANSNINELFQWRDIPIPWDPVPPWIFDQIDERVRAQLFLKDLEVQRVMLQTQLEALNGKIEILQRSLGG
jgi:hypothetical protein